MLNIKQSCCCKLSNTLLVVWDKLSFISVEKDYGTEMCITGIGLTVFILSLYFLQTADTKDLNLNSTKTYDSLLGYSSEKQL